MDFINDHRRKIFVFLIILLTVIAGITGTSKYKPELMERAFGFIIVPVQGFMQDGIENFRSVFAKKQDISELKARNEELEAENAELKEENKRLSMFEKENIELSNLLDINRKYPNYEKMGVHIISADTGNWYNMFTIDRGSRDGITVDMFVVAEGGLAGRVYEVSERYSKVMAIIDDRSAVHGQSRQTEDIGVVKGDVHLMQSQLCTMEFIDLEADMSVGDEIITSVFSEYPAGITIGYVKEISASDDGLTKSAIITPGVSFKDLKKVVVLLGQKNE